MPAVTPLVTRRPSRVSGWLVGRGACGFVGAVLVVVGAAQATSPFTSKLPGSWWFGVPAPSAGASVGTQRQWLGVAFVYAGLVALLAAWYGVVTACRCGGLVPLRPLVGMGVAWALPIVIGPPLMSRDVYAYAAQGALSARGGDPYTTTVARLAGSPYLLHLVDPLWRHATSPYGPLFLELARGAAAAGGRHVLVTVVGLRLVAVAGMVLLALAVPSLARSYGRSPATAFALTVLNPLLLLTLVGGAHNDALMLGLLVAGIALARIGRAVPAVVLCALAATVKVPAFAGVVFVGWSWPGPAAGWRRRLGPVAGAVAGGSGRGVAGFGLGLAVAHGGRSRQGRVLARPGDGGRAPRRQAGCGSRAGRTHCRSSGRGAGGGPSCRGGDRARALVAHGSDRPAGSAGVDASRGRRAGAGRVALV
jgi:alpha-1,6-mannosyltransferase